MGRLMDNIMAAVGLKPSDRVVLQTDSSPPQNRTDQSHSKLAADIRASSVADSNCVAPAIPEAPSEPSPESSLMVESDNESKDCLSCKVTSSAVLFGMSGYVMYNLKYRQIPAHLKKRHQRFSYVATGVLLTTSRYFVNFGNLNR